MMTQHFSVDFKHVGNFSKAHNLTDKHTNIVHAECVNITNAVLALQL